MGFWHTGYAEFHELTGLDGVTYSPAPPVRYICEHCSESFTDLDDLRRHRFERHPSRQPLLFVRGRAIGALPKIVLTALEPTDFVVEDAKHCKVNGEVKALSELGQHLSQMNREFVEIDLSNDGISSRCILDFRISEAEHLAGVEAAFLRIARDRVLNIDAVSRFIQDCRGFESAMPYCDGICHYLYGVMAKEQTSDSGLRQSQYIERYSRARDELSGFDRPLARTVRALVSFHFNQFDEAESLAPEGPLRIASRLFSSLLQGKHWDFDSAFSPKSGSSVEDLLTDQDTLQILADIGGGLHKLKERAEELQAHLRRPGSGYDLFKRTLLVGEAFAARKDAPSAVIARRLARELAANSEARIWGDTLLERLGRYE